MQPRSIQSLSRPLKRSPMLTFSPLAWLKLLFFCHAGDMEIGGFGIAAANDLLYVEDFRTVRQQATPVSVRFFDDAVADFYDQQVDAGLPPARFARLWIHTHPADSVTPSSVDEGTFARTFGRSDWAVMAILGRTGRTYARLAFQAGPGGQVEIPTHVDWAAWPAWLAAHGGTLAAHVAQWQQEYAAHIQLVLDSSIFARFSGPPDILPGVPADAHRDAFGDIWHDFFPELEEGLNPHESAIDPDCF